MCFMVDFATMHPFLQSKQKVVACGLILKARRAHVWRLNCVVSTQGHLFCLGWINKYERQKGKTKTWSTPYSSKAHVCHCLPLWPSPKGCPQESVPRIQLRRRWRWQVQKDPVGNDDSQASQLTDPMCFSFSSV